MANLKLGGVLLVVGVVAFLLSDTLFGDSEVASYSMFIGLILLPTGFVLTLVGVVQVAVHWFKEKTKEE
jgi:hypothetical protein